jgi:hypothetical protein
MKKEIKILSEKVLSEKGVKLIPLRPVRSSKDGFVKFTNEKYPDLNIEQSIQDYHNSSPPSIKVEADDEEILKKYLQSIFRQSFDDDAEFYGRLALHEFQYTYAKDTCQKLGFMAGSRITDKGIELLKYLQQKDIQNKQNKLNWWLVTATIVLAIGTILQVLILLLK